jgi:hypothetical protein
LVFDAGTGDYTRGATRSAIMVDLQPLRVAAFATAAPPDIFRTSLAWAPTGDRLALIQTQPHGPSGMFTIDDGATTLNPLRTTKAVPRGPLVWLPAAAK